MRAEELPFAVVFIYWGTTQETSMGYTLAGAFSMLLDRVAGRWA